MRLVLEEIGSGGDRNFGYLLGDREAATGVLINPSGIPLTSSPNVRALKVLTITHVINTHSHADHTNGNDRALALTGAVLAAHPLMEPESSLGRRPKGARQLATELTSHYVPGHCANSVVLYESVHSLLITGDLLFVGKVGGTQSDEDARNGVAQPAATPDARARRGDRLARARLRCPAKLDDQAGEGHQPVLAAALTKGVSDAEGRVAFGQTAPRIEVSGFSADWITIVDR